MNTRKIMIATIILVSSLLLLNRDTLTRGGRGGWGYRGGIGLGLTLGALGGYPYGYGGYYSPYYGYGGYPYRSQYDDRRQRQRAYDAGREAERLRLEQEKLRQDNAQLRRELAKQKENN